MKVMLYKDKRVLKPNYKKLAAFVFVLYAIIWFSATRHNKEKIKELKTRTVKLTAVLSYYNESIEKTKRTIGAIHAVHENSNIIIYTKTNSSQLQRHLSTETNIQTLVNEGREADSYLHYITNNYYSLPDYTIFTQAEPNDFDQFLKRLNRFDTNMDVLNLGGITECSCNGCFQEDGIMVRVRELYGIATGRLCAESFISFMNGQFIASRSAILLQPLSFYQQLLDMLHAPPDHWIHKDVQHVQMPAYIEDHETDNNNPLFLHVIERLWAPILGCLRPVDGVCLKKTEARLVSKNALPGKTIWLLWLDGWDDAPYIVKRCAESWRYHNPTWNIEYLTDDNIDSYVEIPYIHSDFITPQAKSDLIRLFLLSELGGVWADATLLCMRPLDTWIYTAVQPSGFWAYQGTQYPPPKIINRNNTIYPASWFMISIRGNSIADAWKTAANNYWKYRQKTTDDYFWMDHLFKELYNSDSKMRSEWQKSPYLSCEDAGSAHMFAGRANNRITVQDVLLLKTNPPFVLKLSHKGFPKTQKEFNSKTYMSNSYTAISIALSDTRNVQNQYAWPVGTDATTLFENAVISSCIGFVSLNVSKFMVLDTCDFCKQFTHENFICRPAKPH